MLTALFVATTISLSPAAVAALTPASVASVAEPALSPADIAQREFEALAHGAVDRSHYTPQMSMTMSDAEVAHAAARLAELGDFKRMGLNATHEIHGDMVYVYIMVCANGNARMALSLGPSGLIDGMYFQPWPVAN